MGVPQVVIVGRPNVGKSSLFNWLAGRRIAIVDKTPGVTRDRLSHLMYVRERYFEVVDTGGMGIEDEDDLSAHIEEQIAVAVASADVILFVVDTRTGLMPLDQEVVRRLRYVDVPVLCVANKTDSEALDPQADEFYRLGRGKLVRVSAQQNRGKDALLELILERLPEIFEEEVIRQPVMKLAIVGRRNTGKSTFVNALAHAERVITSEVPGTTRDSIDVHFELDGKSFIAIDTPGLRRGKSISTDLDFFSMHRAARSIRRADVVLLFFDAGQRISKVDKQLANAIAEHYKPCVFVVNKWDLLVNSMPTEKWVTYLRDTYRTMWHVPIAFITAKTGKNVKALINHGQMLFKQARYRVSTSDLNQLIHAAFKHNAPPSDRGRPVKAYYATQVATEPPTIVIICNKPSEIGHTYRRYLLGVMRDRLPYGEVPIKLYLRKRSRSDPASEPLDVEETPLPK